MRDPSHDRAPLDAIATAGGEDQQWIFALVRARRELEAYYRILDVQGGSSWLGVLLDRMRDGIAPSTSFGGRDDDDERRARDEAIIERVEGRLARLDGDERATLEHALCHSPSEDLRAAYGELAHLVARLPDAQRAYAQAVSKGRRKALSFEGWLVARAQSREPTQRMAAQRLRLRAVTDFQNALRHYTEIAHADSDASRNLRPRRARRSPEPAARDRAPHVALQPCPDSEGDGPSARGDE